MLFRFFGLGLVRNFDLEALRAEKVEFDSLRRKLDFFLETKKQWSLKSTLKIGDLVNYSKSESGQDVFALWANNFLKDKVFIEIGAFDGVTCSNTYLLEKIFGWRGILIECIPRSYSLIKNHRDCQIIFGAVSNQLGKKINVFESPAPNLSSIIQKATDNRWKVVSHAVPNYSLGEILQKGESLGKIGFLSVDIEGAEYEVFKDVDLGLYEINAICVEHNFRPDSNNLRNLIESQGYKTVFQEFSGNDFWFIRE